MTPEVEEQLEGLLLATGYDDCILGIAERCGQPNVVAYDSQKIAKSLMRQGMTEEEAWEFFSFNISGAYVGELTPIFVHKLCQPKQKAESTKPTITPSRRCANASSKRSRRAPRAAIRASAGFARKLERERNSLQDQRDFAMGEIERLRKEYFEMLDSAWVLIANAGGGNWDLQTEEWRQAAICFRNWYLSTSASSEEREMEAAK